VEITVARRNGSAVVDVRDHGAGMPEEALPRLFDAFDPVENSRDPSSGGIGLGLSIARRAIELQKGGIRAQCSAKPGSGDGIASSSTLRSKDTLPAIGNLLLAVEFLLSGEA
jgi:signal transduction histidine kinase